MLDSHLRRAIADELGTAFPGQGLTATDLASRLDVHVTTVRFHLGRLVTAGLVEGRVERSGARGRPHRRFVLVEPTNQPVGGAATGSEAPFAVLASVLTSVLAMARSHRLTPPEAGARWAAARAQQVGLRPTAAGADRRAAVVRHVVDLLGEWGYAPEAGLPDDELAVTVTLRHCPFLELAQAHPDVVCGIHRGLLQGTLVAVGETGAHVGLEPLVTPDTCIARLRLADRPGDSPDVPSPLRAGRD